MMSFYYRQNLNCLSSTMLDIFFLFAPKKNSEKKMTNYFRILQIVTLVIVVVCVVEHGCFLMNLNSIKPSQVMAWITKKLILMFWKIGKAIAWISYFVYVIIFDFLRFLKNHFWKYLKRLWKFLKLDVFMLNCQIVIFEILRMLFTPLNIAHGYGVYVWKWIEQKTAGLQGLYSILYILGTCTLCLILYFLWKSPKTWIRAMFWKKQKSSK